MHFTDTLIIGAGQCGLAMSHQLTGMGVDHLVLDAEGAGASWKARHWAALRLLTPNWMNVLPGEPYVGPDPEGFMSAREFAQAMDDWAVRHAPPILKQAEVHRLSRLDRGYLAETAQGPIACRAAVIATGACARPKIPECAAALPPHITQLSPLTYRAPEDLPDGGVLVVGASASGLQIARELARSGRAVTLAAGNHGRLPRRYRGADILHWMHHVGVFDEPYGEVDDIERVRRTPSLPLIGSPEAETLDLNVLQSLGVEITGRLADIRDGKALFSGNLANLCTSADLKMGRLLDRIDQWIDDTGFDAQAAPATRQAPTKVPGDPRLMLDLSGIKTVVWATGFTPDHGFVHMPVFDRKGRIAHDGGDVEPGLIVMGLPYLRTARSVHIDGAGRDAAALAPRILHHLNHQAAA